MKKISSQIPVFLILCGLIATFSAFRVEPKKYRIHTTPVNKYFDVSVGNRTSDSTGSLSINNSGVQQSVISAIGLLSNRTITSENCSLLVGKRSAYLLFNVSDTLGIKSSIAVQLYENGSGAFSFRPGAGKSLHISTGIGGCTNCTYRLEFGVITSSTCNGNAGQLCKYSVHYIM